MEVGFGAFTIEYTAGSAHGQVTANVGAGKASPDKSGVKTYSLATKIEEWVR